LAALPGGADRDQEGDGGALGVFEAGRQADDCFARHGCLLVGGGQPSSRAFHLDADAGAARAEIAERIVVGGDAPALGRPGRRQ